MPSTLTCTLWRPRHASSRMRGMPRRASGTEHLQHALCREGEGGAWGLGGGTLIRKAHAHKTMRCISEGDEKERGHHSVFRELARPRYAQLCPALDQLQLSGRALLELVRLEAIRTQLRGGSGRCRVGSWLLSCVCECHLARCSAAPLPRRALSGSQLPPPPPPPLRSAPHSCTSAWSSCSAAS